MGIQVVLKDRGLLRGRDPQIENHQIRDFFACKKGKFDYNVVDFHFALRFQANDGNNHSEEIPVPMGTVK